MRARHADRIWIGAGVVGAALILAIGYFLLISPANADADGLHEQAEITEVRLISLRQRLVQLQEQKSKMPEYQAELERDKAALPTDSGVPDFLRQLQEAGDNVGAKVSSMTVGAPAQMAGGNSPVYALPVTVTAEGAAGELSRLLDQLQQVQARAVLVESANLAASGAESAGDMSLTLAMKVFVAPGEGQPAPTPVAD